MNGLPVRIKRLISEVEEIKWLIKKGQLTSVEIFEHEEFEYIVLLFSGPMDSPYEGFWFRIRIQWPYDYPFRPPKCLLLDKIWNPYVDFNTNELCIDILQKQHSPALRLLQHILSIISLLSETKISEGSFLNRDAAFQMSKNYPYFFEHARQHCETYSYKKKEIYSDDMRGLPEEHSILIQGSQIPVMIAANQHSNSFNKKRTTYRIQMEIEEQPNIQSEFETKCALKQNEEKRILDEKFKREVENSRKEIQKNLAIYGQVHKPT